MEEQQLLALLDDLYDPTPSRVKRRRFYYDRHDPLTVTNRQEFRRDYRMKRKTFRRLHALVAQDLAAADGRGNPTSTEHKLLVALRFYATGSFHYMTGKAQGYSPSHVCEIVKQVSRVLSSKLPSVLKMPDAETVKLVSVTSLCL